MDNQNSKDEFEPKKIRIVTHHGNAHRDEFLACAIIMSLYQNREIELRRGTPTPEELDSADVFVIDVGCRHEPGLLNFDHHQFQRGTISCALSLVLDYIGMLDTMKAWHPWVEMTEVLDCQGPSKAAGHLGISLDGFLTAQSPVEAALLRCFSNVNGIYFIPLDGDDEEREWLGDAMVAIGDEIIKRAEGLQERLEWLRQNYELIHLRKDLHAIFVSRPDDGLDSPEMAMDALRKELQQANPAADICMSITPDNRGPGYSLYRYNDHKNVDFGQIPLNAPTLNSKVGFIAATGFIAKTHDRCTKATLRSLALAALVGVTVDEPTVTV